MAPIPKFGLPRPRSPRLELPKIKLMPAILSSALHPNQRSKKAKKQRMHHHISDGNSQQQPPPDDLQRHKQRVSFSLDSDHASHRSRRHKSSSSPPSTRTYARRKKGMRRKGPLKKPSEMNPVQRAAVSSFMTKARTGQSSAEDWSRLVSVMKDDNRVQFIEAMGMVMQKRENAKGEVSTNGERGGSMTADNRGWRVVEVCKGAMVVPTIMRMDKKRFYSLLIAFTVVIILVSILGGLNPKMNARDPGLTSTSQKQAQRHKILLDTVSVSPLTEEGTVNLIGSNTSADRIATLEWPIRDIPDSTTNAAEIYNDEPEWKVNQRCSARRCSTSANGPRCYERLNFVSGRGECEWEKSKNHPQYVDTILVSGSAVRPKGMPSFS